MRVDLRTLRQNPIRDFTIDPIDPDQVALLQRSIHEHEFWGGVSLRRGLDDALYIAAGHHRVQAALAEGITEADLTVPSTEWSDVDLVRIYATENATQRGDMGVALTGAVAAAVRVLAKAMALGDFCKILQKLTGHGVDIANGRFEERGEIGRAVIAAFFQGIINDGQITQALENLRASGDYRRILDEVEAEVTREREAAEQARIAAEQEALRLEAAQRDREAEAQRQRAEVARAQEEKASEGQSVVRKAIEGTQTKQRRPYPSMEDRTFDFQGVSKHLKNSNQIAVFRRVVTGKALQEVLPVTRQAALAEQLVRLARERNNAEVSGAFISNNIMSMLMQARSELRQWSQRQEAEARQEDRHRRIEEYQRDLTRGFRLIVKMGKALRTLRKEWPKDIPFPLQSAFQTQQREAMQMMKTLDEEIQP